MWCGSGDEEFCIRQDFPSVVFEPGARLGGLSPLGITTEVMPCGREHRVVADEAWEQTLAVRGINIFGLSQVWRDGSKVHW